MPQTRKPHDFDPRADNDVRTAIYRQILRGGERVLDLGGRLDAVATHLVDHDGREVVLADIEDSGWPARVGDAPFDVIVLADVLDARVRPEDVLSVVRDGRLLAEDGFLVASVHNAAHESTLRSLMSGRLPFIATAAPERQPIRWFTRDSASALCEQQGFLVTAIDRVFLSGPESTVPGAHDDVLGDHALDAQASQFVLRLEPMSLAVQLSQLREELEATRQDLQRRDSEFEGLAVELRRARDVHVRVVAEHDQELTDLRAENEQLAREVRVRRRVGTDEQMTAGRVDLEFRSARQQLERCRAEQRRLEEKLEMVYGSETWRAGQAVLWLPKKLKQLTRR